MVDGMEQIVGKGCEYFNDYVDDAQYVSVDDQGEITTTLNADLSTAESSDTNGITESGAYTVDTRDGSLVNLSNAVGTLRTADLTQTVESTTGNAAQVNKAEDNVKKIIERANQ